MIYKVFGHKTGPYEKLCNMTHQFVDRNANSADMVLYCDMSDPYGQEEADELGIIFIPTVVCFNDAGEEVSRLEHNVGTFDVDLEKVWMYDLEMFMNDCANMTDVEDI